MKFEYKTVNIMPKLRISGKKFEDDFKPKMDAQLKELGEEGWELVNVLSYDSGLKFIMFFKREIKE